MTGRKHRSNMELVAQGIANIASAMFGGISVTGTIARTATNIRAGARSPVSGMVHAVFLLVFMLLAAPLASFIPLSALAGVLVVVCWNMAEKEEFLRLLRDWRTCRRADRDLRPYCDRRPHIRHHRRMRIGRGAGPLRSRQAADRVLNSNCGSVSLRCANWRMRIPVLKKCF